VEKHTNSGIKQILSAVVCMSVSMSVPFVSVVDCDITDIRIFCFVRYLALVAALASEADWVLVPEWPPERGWEDILCNKLAQVCCFVLNPLT